MNEQPQPRPYDAVLGGTSYETPQYPYLNPNDFDAKKLGGLVSEKRGRRGYKDIKKEIGVPLVAVYRAETAHIENRPMPACIHFEDFLAICKWLGVSPAELVLTPALQKILAACGGPSPRPTDAVLGRGDRGNL
ncbi:hypothetical protein QUA54_28450 [Microcoleus sp. MOSTC5]|uniref:hypothetical protein n=1 Tax=Microcoleaceae TaxID=1892252 RepID=UPI0018830BEB|nr:hypothetical protein [Tychonema sp. LEGE 06208]MBE9163998.1 hypothetical protein [Tychonema sp. LEGE 06208]